jgi:hypothetical protein
MSPVDLERAIEKGGPEADLFARLVALRDRFGPLIRERYPKIPRRISGYNLDDLLPERDFHVARALSGTEGTCVVMLEATVTLVPHSRIRKMLVVGFEDVYEAADHVPMVRELRRSGRSTPCLGDAQRPSARCDEAAAPRKGVAHDRVWR